MILRSLLLNSRMVYVNEQKVKQEWKDGCINNRAPYKTQTQKGSIIYKVEAETDGPEEKHRHCLSMHNRFSKAKAQMELSLASDMKGNNKAAKRWEHLTWERN